jgi:hypothetical protein
MIKLNNKDPDWKNWIVQVNDKEYLLGENGYPWGGDIYSFPSRSEEKLTIDLLGNLNFCDIPPQLQLDVTNSNDTLGKYVRSILLVNSKEEAFLGYTWEIDPSNWDGNLNPYLIRDMMFEVLNSQSEFPINISKESSISNEMDTAALHFDIKKSEITKFWNNKNIFSNFLNESVTLAEEKVAIGGFINKVVAKFEFDEYSQQTFSTYLMYFIEFLKDLGIETNGEFKKKGNSLIFSITPKNKDVALTQISEALAFYLKLPQINLNDVSDVSDVNSNPIAELKLEKLRSEIERLKSNQRINEALLKYQDSLIYKLNSNQLKVIEQPKINAPIDSVSYIYVDDKKQEKKSFLSGGIKLGVMKKAGIEIDWSSLIGHFRSK